MQKVVLNNGVEMPILGFRIRSCLISNGPSAFVPNGVAWCGAILARGTGEANEVVCMDAPFGNAIRLKRAG